MQWRNWIARHRKSVVTTAVIVVLVPVWVLTLTVVTGQSAKDDWVYVPNCNVTHTTKDAASSGNDDSEPSAPAGGGGDWLTKGTEQYNTAVAVGKWWKNKGASASGIWGVMGNVAQESRFVYNIYQNGGTRDDPLNIHGSIGTPGCAQRKESLRRTTITGVWIGPCPSVSVRTAVEVFECGATKKFEMACAHRSHHNFRELKSLC